MTNYENLQTVVGDLLSADAKCGLKPNMDRKLLREQHDAIAALRSENAALKEQTSVLESVVTGNTELIETQEQQIAAKDAEIARLLHLINMDWDCLPTCDKFAHDPECPYCNGEPKLRILAERAEKAEADNAATEVMPTAAVRRYSLLRLRFFRDLTGAQRLSVLVKLKVLPPEWRQALTHAIETQILDSLQNTGRLDELEAAFADALERGND